MGLYDSVITECPDCEAPIEFQSKAGNRALECFNKYEVPVDIANDIDGNIEYCSNCGCPVHIQISIMPQTTRMIVFKEE